jgi:hypothetical protein
MSIRYYYKVTATVEFMVCGDTIDDATDAAIDLLDTFIEHDGNHILLAVLYDKPKTDREAE